MKRSTVRFISSFMETQGFPTDDTKKYTFFRICRLIIFFFYTIWCPTQFFVLGIMQLNDSYRSALPLSYWGITLVLFSCVAANFHVLRQTTQLFKNIDENIFTYADDLQIYPLEERNFYEKNTLRILRYVSYVFFFSTILDILNPLFQLLLMDQVTVIVYPGWIPWSTDGIIPFVCTYLLQVGGIVSGTVTLSFLNCFPMFVMLEFRQQCKKLNFALRTVESRSRDEYLSKLRNKTVYERSRDVQFSVEYRNNIISCIRHYQTLISMFELFQPWWQIVFSTQLVTTTPAFTLSIVGFLETNLIEDRIGLFTVIWVVGLGLLFYSYIGEEFLKLNEEIQNTIFYEVPWYQAPAEIKRLLMVFHLLVSNRPFTLNGLNIFQASYRVFGYICKSSYSYINVLRTTLKQ